MKPCPTPASLERRLQTVPPYDPALERAVLASMLAWPEAAKVAAERLSDSAFYSPAHKAVFKNLGYQYTRLGACDVELLASSSGGAEAQSLGRLILTLSGPFAMEEYCDKLLTIEARRKGLIVAGELLSGVDLKDVARTVQDLSATRGQVESGGVEKLTAQVQDEIEGKRRAVAFPNWPVLSSTQMLLPGTLSVLCGSPGVSKSFFAIEPVWRWHQGGETVAALELESGQPFHLRRALAQMLGNGLLTRASWCKAHDDEATAALTDNQDWLKARAKAIQAPVIGDAPTVDYLTRWMRSACQDGARVVVIDPITLMQTGQQGFKDHERFVAESKNVATRYGASILLVSHPKRGMPGHPIMPCLENLPNSSAYERFSDTILWLEWVAESEDTFFQPMGTEIRKFNRLLHCLKVRLDVNPKRIGYWFDAATLRHVECGRLAE